MTYEPFPVARPGSGGSSGSGPGSGRGGGGAGDAGRFVAQAIARLNDEGITADRSFLSLLQDFANDGLDRAGQEGSGPGDVGTRWPQVVNMIVQYSSDNGLHHLNAGAFDGIRERLCPGFWPFC